MTGTISLKNKADKNKKKSAVVRGMPLIRCAFVLLEICFSWDALNGKDVNKQGQRGVIIYCPCHWECVYEGNCLCVLHYKSKH